MTDPLTPKVATTQRLTPGAQFHGQASEKPADTVDALFDLSSTSFEPQDGPVAPVQPANLPRLFRVKHFEVGTSQTKHCGNKALGIRTQPLIRHPLDFNRGGSTLGFSFQAWEEKVLVVPLRATEHNKITSFDVKTGVVSSIPAKSMRVRTLIATQTGFAMLWNGTENGRTGEFLTHIDARTNTISWTKLLSDDPRTTGFYLQETATGELVAMCDIGEPGRDKFQLLRFDDTGEPLGRTGADAMIDFDAYHPLRQPVFFCDDTSESIVLAAQDRYGGQRLVSVNFKDQSADTICDLLFPLSDFEKKLALKNGRVLMFPSDGTQEGCDVTFRTLSDYEIKPLACDFTALEGSEFVTNTNEDFAVMASDEAGALIFHQMTDDGFERVKVIERLGVYARVSSAALAVTQDNVVYYSAVTARRVGEVDCRLFAYDASSAEKLWSINRTFDEVASIAVNDDGSLSWFTASGGVILAAP